MTANKIAMGLLVTGLGVVGAAAVFLFGADQINIAKGEAPMTSEVCSETNLMLFEGRLTRAMGAMPGLIGAAHCYKTEYSSDMIAAAQLDPSGPLPDWDFAPATQAEGVPLDFLYRLYPEVFTVEALKTVKIATRFDPDSGAIVTLVQPANAGRFVLISEQM